MKYSTSIDVIGHRATLAFCSFCAVTNPCDAMRCYPLCLLIPGDDEFRPKGKCVCPDGYDFLNPNSGTNCRVRKYTQTFPHKHLKRHLFDAWDVYVLFRCGCVWLQLWKLDFPTRRSAVASTADRVIETE